MIIFLSSYFLFIRVNNPKSEFNDCLADKNGEVLRFDPDNSPTPQQGGKSVQLMFKALPHHSARTKGGKQNKPIPVANEHELSRLFLQDFYSKELDCNINTIDPGGIFRVLKGASCFPDETKKRAEDAREIRNLWAHAVIEQWDEPQLDNAFSKMEALATAIPNNSRLIQKLKENKEMITMKVETIEQLKKELQTLSFEIAKLSKNDCEHCGRPKQASINDTPAICVCCSVLRCSQIIPKPSAENNLENLLDELTEGLAPSNTPDHKDFAEIKE